MLDWWCQKQEALTMIVEIARTRIAKIRNDLCYSTNGLNNKLGLISKKEEEYFESDKSVCWSEIK